MNKQDLIQLLKEGFIAHPHSEPTAASSSATKDTPEPSSTTTAPTPTTPPAASEPTSKSSSSQFTSLFLWQMPSVLLL